MIVELLVSALLACAAEPLDPPQVETPAPVIRRSAPQELALQLAA